MKKQWAFILWIVLQSASISPLAMAISDRGKFTPMKEGIMISVFVALFSASLLVFHRAKLGHDLNPRLNPRLKKLFTQYPLLLGLVSSVAGLTVAIVVLRLLGGN